MEVYTFYTCSESACIGPNLMCFHPIPKKYLQDGIYSYTFVSSSQLKEAWIIINVVVKNVCLSQYVSLAKCPIEVLPQKKV